MHDWIKTALVSTNARQNAKGGLGDQSAAKTLSGDEAAARLYLPIAQQLLGALANFMQLGGVTYGTRTITLPDGARIQVIRNYALNTIRIFANPLLSGASGQELVLGGFIGDPNDLFLAWEAVFIRTVFSWSATQPNPKNYANSTLKAGPVSWWGRLVYNSNLDYHPVALSWDHGMPCRYRLSTSEDLECGGRFLRLDEAGEPVFANSGLPDLYYQGVAIPTDHNVVGAAIIDDRFIYVSYIDLTWVDDPNDNELTNLINRANNNAKHATFFISSPFRHGAIGSLTWTKIAVIVAETSTFKAPWFFNPLGNKASTVLEGYVGQFYVHEATIAAFDGGNFYSVTDNSTERQFDAPMALLADLPETTSTALPSESTYEEWYVEWWGGSDASARWLLLDDVMGEVLTVSKNILAIEQAKCTTTPPTSIDYDYITEKIGGFVSAVNSFTDTLIITSPYYTEPWAAAGHVKYYEAGSPAPTAEDIMGLYMPIFGDFITPVCVPVEGAIVEFGLIPMRSTRSFSPTTNQEKVYQSTFTAKRLVAIDYSFDNEKMEVVQELKNPQPDFTLNTNTRSYNFGNRALKLLFSGPTQEYGTAITFINSWTIATEWVLSVNDEPLVTAFGGIDNENNTYERTILKLMDVSSGPATYNYEFSESDIPTIRTERVWLLDVDARTRSAVYNKITTTADITPIQDEVDLHADDVDWLYYSGWILSEVALQNRQKESAIIAVHDNEEVARKVVPNANEYSIGGLVNRGAPLQLLPRMFSQNDVYENIIPGTMAWSEDVHSYTPYVWREWNVEPEDCFPTMRDKGSLAVRDTDHAIASVSDESLIGNIGAPCVNATVERSKQNINMALFDGVSYQLESELLTTLNDAREEDAPTAVFKDEFNFRPVRVV